MKKQEILTILIPTFICIIAWIGFNIYHSAVTSTITSEESIQILPISATFNTNVIEELKKRERVEPFFKNSSNSAVILRTPTPNRVIQAPQVATSSSDIATVSGELDTEGVNNL